MRQATKRLMVFFILSLWLLYSGLRIVKHGWLVVTRSWEPQQTLPFYLQDSPFYETYEELKHQ
jgi:hypothetical protein